LSAEVAAYVYAIAVAVVGSFQIALVCGAPWGNLAMGGRYPGRLPGSVRVAVGAQTLLLVLFTGVIWVRAGLILPQFLGQSQSFAWVVVGVGLISLVMNLITPSKYERLLWAPVALVMFVASVIVARNT
jgi:hypothetical protein